MEQSSTLAAFSVQLIRYSRAWLVQGFETADRRKLALLYHHIESEHLLTQGGVHFRGREGHSRGVLG